MNENQFNAMLAIIVPPIIEQITKNSNVDDNKAISGFYQSRLYQELSDENSKLWHYSPMTLYTMYQDELLTGSYDYPGGGLSDEKGIRFCDLLYGKISLLQRPFLWSRRHEDFEKYDIYGYIIKYFEALHTMGDHCIVQDIDDYIAGRSK